MFKNTSNINQPQPNKNFYAFFKLYSFYRQLKINLPCYAIIICIYYISPRSDEQSYITNLKIPERLLKFLMCETRLNFQKKILSKLTIGKLFNKLDFV